MTTVTADRLAAQLDGAQAVVYDSRGYVIAWFGGTSTGIHVYGLDGAEVAYWTANGDEPFGPEVAFRSMREHLADWDDLYA